MFSFHWAAPAAAPAQNLTGILYTVNISYVDFAPVGNVVAAMNWPQLSEGASKDGAPLQPIVYALSYSAALPNSISTLAYCTIDPFTGAFWAQMDPLTLNAKGGLFHADQSEYVSPRILTTTDASNPEIIIAEYVAPYRYTVVNVNAGTQVTGNIAFDSAPTGTNVLGLHSWN